MTSELFPLSAPAKVHHNTGEVELIEVAIRRGEARFAASGALAVETGAHTGRSAQDKYTVRDATTEKAVWWDNNKPMTPEQFELLLGRLSAARQDRASCSCRTCYAGADPAHRLNARIFIEYAWHALFIRHLLRRPQPSELAGFEPRVHRHQPAELQGRSQTPRRAQRDGDRLQLRQAAGADRRHAPMPARPRNRSSPISTTSMPEKRRDADALLGQRRPRRRCGRSSSACRAPARRRCRPIPSASLLGDDEHGWSDDGIYNFEGGCYAKTIRLSKEAEPADLGRHQPLRHGAGERRSSIPARACPTSTTAA